MARYKRKREEKKLKTKLARLKKRLSHLHKESSSSDDSSSSESSLSTSSEYSHGSVKTEIQDDIKSLLGVHPSHAEQEGPELHDEIVDRWTAVLKKGLDKDTRKDLLEKYPRVKNCILLNAPKLNGEIEASLPESCIKQDKFLQILQNHIGSSISVIGTPMNNLVISGDKENVVLPYLIDVGKLLTDMHHSLSMHRRYLIEPQINRNLKKLLDESVIGEYLFGDNLTERLKSSQALKRTGTALVKPTKRFVPTASTSLNSQRQVKRTRWKATGGQRERSDRPRELTTEKRRRYKQPFPPPKY